MEAIILLAVIFLHCVHAQDQCFRAAVVDYVREDGFFEVRDNLNAHEDIIATAARNGAKIVVFPENGLFNPPSTK